MTNNTEITKLVSDELVEKTLDIAFDYSELGLDTILEDGILKDIPFVKSVVSFYNISNSLLDRHKVKKILTFFREFNRNEINQEKLNKFKTKFSNNKSYQDKVVETIVLLNERFLQVEKSKILANLIKAHIEENLTWQELQDISYILDSIHPKGFDYLKRMSNENNWAYHNKDQDSEPLMFACGIGHRDGSRFSIRPMGQKLFIYGIKPMTE